MYKHAQQKRVMRRREAARAGDKRRRIDEIAQEGPLLNEIRCAVNQVSAGEMNTSKWHNQILSIVLSSVTSTFANRACAQRRNSGSQKFSIFNIETQFYFCLFERPKMPFLFSARDVFRTERRNWLEK